MSRIACMAHFQKAIHFGDGDAIRVGRPAELPLWLEAHGSYIIISANKQLWRRRRDLHTRPISGSTAFKAG